MGELVVLYVAACVFVTQDPLTSTVLRYFGFVNDVGEACKSFLPRPLYFGSYAVTTAYATGTNRACLQSACACVRAVGGDAVCGC